MATKITPTSLLRLIVLGCVLPVIMSAIVYQAFSTNYTTQVFSEESFKAQYEKGIYRYRVLGSSLLLKTYRYIKENNLPAFAPRSLSLLDENGDPYFYSAYFYLNTFFLSLTCLTLLFILGGDSAAPGFLTVDLPVLFLCFLMAITQYAVVPYDTLSYFLLSLAVLLILHDPQTALTRLALGAVIVLATLARETAFLILSFYFALHFRSTWTNPFRAGPNPQQGTLLFLAACFAFTYLGLRIVFGTESGLFQDIPASNGFGGLSIIGTLFLASILLLVFTSRPVTKEMTVFLAASLPYILPMLFIALPSEIRLWTPLLLLLVVLKVRAVSAGFLPVAVK